MKDNRIFYVGATLTALVFLFLVVLPESLKEYFAGYPQLSIQLGLYLTSLSLGTMFLNGFRDRVTCIWLAGAMLASYSVYAYKIENATGTDDYSVASLTGTIVWALLLFSRHIVNKHFFFVLGIFPTFRPIARQYLKATAPSFFQKTVNYYIASCLLFDVFFTLLWRGLPIYFGSLVEGSLYKTFDSHGWPDLFDIYYDLNNLLVSAAIIFIPLFIIKESINRRSP